MSEDARPLLFSPLRIGPVTAPNRIVCGAHFTQFVEPATTVGEPGYYGARYGRYLGERAAGGTGVIVAGQAQVHPTTAYQMRNNAIAWDEAAIPHFEQVTAPIHEHGALAFLQLAHNGGVNDGTWSKLPAWAPSAVANYNEPPKSLEQDEIRELVEYFGRSAANAAAGGFDGIEVHGAHGYLIHEFLSPKSNLRTDEYGGSLENRMRFCVEVLDAVRTEVGDGVAVGLRLVGDEEQRDGSGLAADDAAEIAARLEDAGLVDFVHVSVGVSGMGMVRPLYAPHLLGVYAAHTVKKALRDTPVFAVHRVLTPDEAEGILERGEADAVTLVRALIADPDWGVKARGGVDETIRRCTGCNQGCYGNLIQSLPITCVTNPAVGRETELGAGTLRPAAVAKRVVVVGAGPAGLEAAWVAAARGHEVTLLERSDELGGKIRLAQSLPGREELADFADWRIGEGARRGVDVRVGVDATADDVLALAPDAVVVATGSRATTAGASKWHPMPVPGSEQPFVIDHEQALLVADELDGRVVILDVVGHIEAIGLGERLAARGAEVTVACPLPTPMLLDPETMAAALPRMARAGARWRPNTAMVSIGDHEVTLIDTLSLTMETAPADTVVIRTHGLPNDDLYFALQDRVPEVVRIGDAVAARTADRAIFDGHRGAGAVAVGDDPVTVETADGVAVVTLNRPDRLNAFTGAIGDGLGRAYAACDEDDGVRAVVVTGAGRAFCAGADMEPGADTFAAPTSDEFTASPVDPPAWGVRKPVLAAINGHAIGIGLTLAMQCDIRLVAEDAKLGFVHVRRGVIPDAHSHWTVPRAIGFARAADLLLTGRTFTGREAAELGLAGRALPADDVLPAALDIARDIAVHTAPQSVALSKRLLWASPALDRDEIGRLETEYHRLVMGTPDAREGVLAWLERRDPKWTGKPT